MSSSSIIRIAGLNRQCELLLLFVQRDKTLSQEITDYFPIRGNAACELFGAEELSKEALPGPP